MQNRILKEIAELEENAPEFVESFTVDQGDISRWTFIIKGPENTPYEGGKYILSMTIPQQYPFKPPEFRFMSENCFPRVQPNGEPCCDCATFRNGWWPGKNIKNSLRSLYEDIQIFESECFKDHEIRFLYHQDRQLFYRMLRLHTIRDCFK